MNSTPLRLRATTPSKSTFSFRASRSTGRYLDCPYYITPEGRVGQEAFAVIREAMRGEGMVALGRVVLSKRERVVMLESWDKVLVATTLRYPYEIWDAKEYFDDIPDFQLEPDMLKLAKQILQSARSLICGTPIELYGNEDGNRFVLEARGKDHCLAMSALSVCPKTI